MVDRTYLQLFWHNVGIVGTTASHLLDIGATAPSFRPLVYPVKVCWRTINRLTCRISHTDWPHELLHWLAELAHPV